MIAAVWMRNDSRIRIASRPWWAAVAGARLLVVVVGIALIGVGCTVPPRILTADEQRVIDRDRVEYPAGYELHRIITNLTAPTALAFLQDGSLLVAIGERDEEPTIRRFMLGSGKQELFYPHNRTLPFALPLTGWKMYGPIGGMAVYQGVVYVSHRDSEGFGVITALDDKGGHRTVVSRLPAQGDYGVTDVAIDKQGLLWFGVGTATNSGVVGVDNWEWVREHPEVHDVPFRDSVLQGFHFNSFNPRSGLFGSADIAVTGPFQSFGQNFPLRVPGARDGKPSGVICSVSTQGGSVKVECFGLHNPRGIAFGSLDLAYFTDAGMEPRGSRPVLHDPDALMKWQPGQPWYGWPDYSRSLKSVKEDEFQPSADLIAGTGYPQIRPLLSEADSKLAGPVLETQLSVTFPWMAGAGKLQFVPAEGPFSEFSGNFIVALSGDRLPFATGGRPLIGPGDYKVPNGYKLVLVDVDRHTVKDFVRNTRNLPASKIPSHDSSLLERPIDQKLGPDGALYILDMGRMEVKNGVEHYRRGSGQIFRLVSSPARLPETTATTQVTTSP